MNERKGLSYKGSAVDTGTQDIFTSSPLPRGPNSTDTTTTTTCKAQNLFHRDCSKLALYTHTHARARGHLHSLET